MSSIKSVMVVRKSSAKEIVDELLNELSNEGLVLKIVEDYIFDSMFDLNTENVEVEMSDDTFNFIAKKAHEKNITFNQMVTEILSEKLRKLDDSRE